MNNFKLCYVNLPWSYFTTQSLEDQWGDDWNDAPYQHNAGSPYEPCWHNKPDSERRPCDCSACEDDWTDDLEPKWQVIKIALDTSLVTPSFHVTEDLSVQDINQKKYPWLMSYNREIEIWAGETVEEVMEQISKSGGDFYVNIDDFTGITNKFTIGIPND